MSRPIPKHLLKHKAYWYSSALLPESEWDDANPTLEEVLEKGIVLTFVRFEPYEEVFYRPTNEEVRLRAIMFYDFVNSRPKNIPFKTKDFLLFEDTLLGNTFFRIQRIPLLAGDKRRPFHHLELELS